MYTYLCVATNTPSQAGGGGAEAYSAVRCRYRRLGPSPGSRDSARPNRFVAAAGELPADKNPLLEAYDRGMEAYRAQEWATAAAAFAAALALDPHDGPSALYLRRAEEFLAAPPPITWDGVYVATHK